MLEIAILTCVEAHVLIGNLRGAELPLPVRLEIAEEILNRSECDGNVRLSEDAPVILEN